MTAHFIFPLAMYEGFIFSTSSPTLVISCRFDDSHPSGCEVVSHCDFGLHFLNASNVEQFSCAYWTLLYLLWRSACLNSLPFFNWAKLSY